MAATASTSQPPSQGSASTHPSHQPHAHHTTHLVAPAPRRPIPLVVRQRREQRDLERHEGPYPHPSHTPLRAAPYPSPTAGVGSGSSASTRSTTASSSGGGHSRPGSRSSILSALNATAATASGAGAASDMPLPRPSSSAAEHRAITDGVQSMALHHQHQHQPAPATSTGAPAFDPDLTPTKARMKQAREVLASGREPQSEERDGAADVFGPPPPEAQAKPELGERKESDSSLLSSGDEPALSDSYSLSPLPAGTSPLSPASSSGPLSPRKTQPLASEGEADSYFPPSATASLQPSTPGSNPLLLTPHHAFALGLHPHPNGSITGMIPPSPISRNHTRNPLIKGFGFVRGAHVHGGGGLEDEGEDEEGTALSARHEGEGEEGEAPGGALLLGLDVGGAPEGRPSLSAAATQGQAA